LSAELRADATIRGTTFEEFVAPFREDDAKAP
jgi:hypothetical protein